MENAVSASGTESAQRKDVKLTKETTGNEIEEKLSTMDDCQSQGERPNRPEAYK